MTKKQKYKKLMDKVLNAVIKRSAKSKNHSADLVLTKDVLNVFNNLNQQIEEQRKYVAGIEKKTEKKIEKVGNKLNILIKELHRLEYLNIKEKRNLLKRTTLTQEALINLANEKGLIKSTELQRTLKRLRKSKSKN